MLSRPATLLIYVTRALLWPGMVDLQKRGWTIDSWCEERPGHCVISVERIG